MYTYPACCNIDEKHKNNFFTQHIKKTTCFHVSVLLALYFLLPECKNTSIIPSTIKNDSLCKDFFIFC